RQRPSAPLVRGRPGPGGASGRPARRLDPADPLGARPLADAGHAGTPARRGRDSPAPARIAWAGPRAQRAPVVHAVSALGSRVFLLPRPVVVSRPFVSGPPSGNRGSGGTPGHLCRLDQVWPGAFAARFHAGRPALYALENPDLPGLRVPPS